MASIKGLARRVARFPASVLTTKRVRDHHRQMAANPIDPAIQYPSYVDLDDLLDVERLRSLDGYIIERLERRAPELVQGVQGLRDPQVVAHLRDPAGAPAAIP